MFHKTNIILPKDRQYLYQFIPKEYEYLTGIKKIPYNGINLKTDYLINIIHELVIKYFFTNEVKFNLWSVLLRNKYGKYYNYYINYLIEKRFMTLVSNYYVSKKAKTYKLNITDLEITKCVVDDKILMKKYQKDYLERSFTTYVNSPIDIEIRKKLIDYLYYVQIDYQKSIDYIDDLWENGEMENSKYLRNHNSVDGIQTGNIFFKFDGYGRMHTNFTILKKEIRNRFLKIDGEPVDEVDIKNSQPFFFGLYLKQEIDELNEEVIRFIDIVKNGLIYDEFTERFPLELKTRTDAKLMMFKVLFGNNNGNRENNIFGELYPSVLEYIKELKSLDDTYKSLSHKLQRMESDFIYGKVVSDIAKKYPHIKIFTIHDSVVYPKKYSEEVKLVFNYHLRNLI